MARKFVPLVLVLSLTLGFGATPAWADGDEAMAKELTYLLVASRAVLVKNKPLIKNPTGSGVTTQQFLDQTAINYEKIAGRKFKEGGGDVKQGQDWMIEAIRYTVDNVLTGKDDKLDPNGWFLPAIFARKVADKFGSLSGGTMYLKLTTQDGYLLNPANKADAWEKAVIEQKFMQAGWKKGKSFSEVAQHNGKKAFRLIMPEYFKEGCMGCHGGATGAKVHPSKKGGTVGELGGAISVAIYKK